MAFSFPNSFQFLPSLLMMLCCGRPNWGPESGSGHDTKTYLSIVSAQSPDPDRDLARCRTIESTSARGDCELHVAFNGAIANGEPPETWCDQVSMEPWASECRFQAAEQWLLDKDHARAAKLCAETGPFRDDCAQHLWMRAMQGTVPKGRNLESAESMMQSLRKARKIRNQWIPLVGETSDFSRRYWQLYYENLFDRAPRIDLTRCDALLATDRIHCRFGGATLFRRRLLDRLRSADGKRKVCTSKDSTIETLGDRLPGLRALPDPILDGVVSEQFDWVCAKGNTEPLEGGVLSDEAWARALADAEQSMNGGTGNNNDTNP